MENDLHIHKLAAAHVNIHARTKEFFGQDRNIKAVGIESCQVAAFNVVGNIARHFLEGGTVGHILVIDAMHAGGFLGNVHFGIDAHGFGFFVAIRINLQITDFHYPVRIDIGTGGLQIEEDQRIL